MSSFKSKVVVVRGDNSGMGLAAAKEFSRLGAKVDISGRLAEGCRFFYPFEPTFCESPRSGHLK